MTATVPATPTVLVVERDARLRQTLVRALGPDTVALASVEEMRSLLAGGAQQSSPALSPVVVVSGPSLDPASLVPFVATHPAGAVVAVHGLARTADLRAAMAAGVGDLVGADAPVAQLRHAVRRAGVAAQVGAGRPAAPSACAPVSVVPAPEPVGERFVPEAGFSQAVTRPAPPAPQTAQADLPAAVAPESDVDAPGASAGRMTGGLVAVMGPKGGAGSTTIAVNLAVALAVGAPAGVDDAPVAVVVDTDLQFGDAALVCGVDPARSMASLRRGGSVPVGPTPDVTSVSRALVRLPDAAVALLAAPVDPALSETFDPGFVADVLDALVACAAWVVVDLPAAIDDRVMAVLDRASSILVVASPDPLAAKDARSAVDVLDQLGFGARWSLVCNLTSGHPGVGVGALEQHLGRRVLACVPHDAGVPAAVLRGRPVVLDAPSAPASQALIGLADALRTPVPTDAVPTPSLRHVVDRLVGGSLRWRTSGS